MQQNERPRRRRLSSRAAAAREPCRSKWRSGETGSSGRRLAHDAPADLVADGPAVGFEGGLFLTFARPADVHPRAGVPAAAPERALFALPAAAGCLVEGFAHAGAELGVLDHPAEELVNRVAEQPEHRQLDQPKHTDLLVVVIRRPRTAGRRSRAYG